MALQLLRLGRLAARGSAPRSALASTSAPAPASASRASSSMAAAVGEKAAEDFAALRALFDGGGGFEHAQRGEKGGLLGRRVLARPEGFREAAADARQRVAASVDQLLAADARGDHGQTLRLLDTVSNDLCRVLDMTECLRQVHPVKAYRDAALAAQIELCGYMDQLNANPALYRALKNFSEAPGFAEETEEAKFSTQQLLHDFEAGGIGLPDAERDLVVRATGELEQLRFDLEAEMANVGANIDVNPKEVAGIEWMQPPTSWLNDASTTLRLADTNSFRQALEDASNPKTRQRVHLASFDSNASLEQKLQTLFQGRFFLARKVGFASFAHKELEMSMAKDPAIVDSFFSEMSNGLRDIVPSQFERLGGKPSEFETWNVPRLLATARNGDIFNQAMHYMSVGTCIAGANMIIKRLYGVSFRAEKPAPGEVWHPSVRKLVVVDDMTNEELGVLYCDLYRRDDKNNHGSHYTLQSGRRMGSADSGGKPQKAIVALVCGIRQANKFITYHEANTLFHELGHAMHSMLSNTEYQNVSGTRGSLDFGELPSSFFEHFLLDPRVLPLFARHHVTNEPMPHALAEALRVEATRFAPFDMESSLMLSAMDQHYHSADYVTSNNSLFQGLEQVHDKFGIFPFDKAPRYTRFTHLLGYGANYYSYLWCQGLASMLWQHCFQADPLNASSGRQFRQCILARGSGRDQWDMLEDVLGWRPTASDVANALLTDAVNASKASPSATRGA